MFYHCYGHCKYGYKFITKSAVQAKPRHVWNSFLIFGKLNPSNFKLAAIIRQGPQICFILL